MKKPGWFRLIDLVSFAGLGVLSGGVTIYAMASGVQGEHARQGVVLCWVVTAAFIAIWAQFAMARKRWLDEFTWYPKFGIMAHPGDGYVLPDQKKMDDVVESVVEKWFQHFPKAKQIVQEKVVWCWFRKDLDETDRNLAGRRVKGYVVSGTRLMLVDYDEPGQDLEETAFEHELGHIIMGNATGEWDQETHHAFMSKNGMK